VPVGVLLLALGLLIGPHLLGLASVNELLSYMHHLGTGALFFMAGMELDLERVKGRPLSLALRAWLVSLVLAFALARLLHALPFVGSPVMLAIALTTTALGMLVPILRDSRNLSTPFGQRVLAAGAVGELGPVLAMSLLFTGGHTAWHAAVLMLVFTVLTVSCALIALRLRSPGLVALLMRGMYTSAQLPVLVVMLVLVGLSALAEEIGLEAVLGAFAAGMVTGLATRGEEGRPMRAKLEAVCFGFLVPFFYVVSGMKFDLTALSGSAKALWLMPLFAALLLIVRGTPVWFYRADLCVKERIAFVLYTSTGLPILIAVTNIGVQSGRMLPEIGAALVGAGMLSVLAFPALAAHVLRRHANP
jgi:Kef-type K+ transport system membrane component KefB